MIGAGRGAVTPTVKPTLLAALLAVVAAPARAHEAPRSLPTSLGEHGGNVVASLDLAAAFPPELRKALSNGLTNVIMLHVALVPERGDPVALYGREVDVLYDVWDETWGVTVKDPLTPAGRSAVYREWPALLRFLSSVRAELGPAAGLRAGPWIVQTRVELNPVSQELLRRTREFIANPAATGRGGVPSRSVLGAMASYLLHAEDPGDDVHVFRSGPFTVHEAGRP